MNKYIVVAKIAGVHGVHGELKCQPLIDDPIALKKIKSGCLVNEKTAACFVSEEDEEKYFKSGKEVSISSWKISNGRVVCLFDGIEDRDEAKKNTGLYLVTKKSILPKLPKGRFFIIDLLGSTVIDDELGEIGILKDIIQTGANDVLAVRREKKRDLLIPFLNQVVYEVQAENKKIFVRLPDGLYDIYE